MPHGSGGRVAPGRFRPDPLSGGVEYARDVFRHVVSFRWRDDADPAAVEAVARELARLPGLIEEIRGYELGHDAGVSDGTYDFVLVATFDDEAGFRRYRDHPEHRRVVEEHIRPIVESIVRVQTRAEAP